MTDEPSGIAPNPIHPETNVFGQPVNAGQSVQNAAYNQGLGQSKPAEPKEPEIDHLAAIAELAQGLHNCSPSGAETVRGQILAHVSALQEKAK